MQVGGREFRDSLPTGLARVPVIELVSLAFGSYPNVESFNSGFRPGHPKMCLTLDGEPDAEVGDAVLHRRLVEAFPGLTAHLCQAGGSDPRRGICLVEDDPTANQAHLLEHLMLEMLSSLDGVGRLSGVTCAYSSPPERSDIFVECDRPDSGSLVSLMALEAMNAALAGEPLAPCYPDMLVCARELRGCSADAWLAAGLARATGLPTGRTAAALEALSRVRVVQEVPFAMNFSGEPLYRFVGVGGTSA